MHPWTTLASLLVNIHGVFRQCGNCQTFPGILTNFFLLLLLCSPPPPPPPPSTDTAILHVVWSYAPDHSGSSIFYGLAAVFFFFLSFGFFKSFITSSLHIFFRPPSVLTRTGFQSVIFLTINFVVHTGHVLTFRIFKNQQYALMTLQ